MWVMSWHVIVSLWEIMQDFRTGNIGDMLKSDNY